MRNEVKLRAGLVGAGQICAYHVAALRRLPWVEIVGLYDVDAARADKSSAELGIPAMPSIEALRHAGADVIHVLTPPHTHAKVALLAMDLGCHVYVEKPAAVDVADCRTMENVASARGLQVCVGHSLLYDPQVRKALAIAHSGRLGRIVAVDYLRSSMYPPYEGGPLPPQYRSAGYPFRDLGVHALYLFEAFLGPIEHVQADWKSIGGAPNVTFDEWRAQVRCRDGMAQCQLSWNVRPMQSQLIIQGTKGVLRVDLFLMFHSLRSASRLPKPMERILNAWTDNFSALVQVPKGIIGYITGRVLPYHGLQTLVAEFYRALTDGAPAPVSLGDAKRVVQWTERIARLADLDHHRRMSSLRLGDHAPVLVTGASGAMGSAIVARLRDEGRLVRIFVRRAPETAIDGVEVAVGDLGDAEAVDRAMRGVQVVIHAGAAMRGSWPQFRCATVIGTKNVIDACLAHRVKKLVHISSLSVLDWAGADRADEPLDETSALEPHAERRGGYTRSKLDAENLVVGAARDRGLPAIILRPGQIFGGSIPLLTAAVARAVGRRWIVLGNGEQRLPLVHMDDVVDAICHAVQCSASSGEIVHVIDGSMPTQNEVLKGVLGADARVWHIPRWVVMTAAAGAGMIFRLARRSSPVSAYRMQSAMSRCTFTTKNRDLLEGWRPVIGLHAGIDRDANATSQRSRPRTARTVPAAELLLNEPGDVVFDPGTSASGQRA